MRLAAIACGALLLCSCAHTYKAPSNAKLEASTGRLSSAVAKASNTEQRASAHVDAAKKAADKEAASSASVLTTLDDLLKVLPPELKAKGDALKTAVQNDQADIGEIVTHVDGAQTEHGQLKKELLEARSADAQVKIDKQQYYADADKLALTATKQSKSLTWYRWHWWGSWITLGAGVIVCIIAAVVKWGAKWTGKVAVAAGKVGI